MPGKEPEGGGVRRREPGDPAPQRDNVPPARGVARRLQRHAARARQPRPQPRQQAGAERERGCQPPGCLGNGRMC